MLWAKNFTFKNDNYLTKKFTIIWLEQAFPRNGSTVVVSIFFPADVLHTIPWRLISLIQNSCPYSKAVLLRILSGLAGIYRLSSTRGQTTSGYQSFTHIFPLFASDTRICFKFWFIHCIVCVLMLLAREITLILALRHNWKTPLSRSDI